MNIADPKETLRKVVIALVISAAAIWQAYERLGFWEAYSVAITAISLALGWDVKTLGKWAGERMENG